MCVAAVLVQLIQCWQLAVVRAGSVAAAGDDLQGKSISPAWLHLGLLGVVPAHEEAVAQPAAVLGSGAKSARLFVSLKRITVTGGAAHANMLFGGT